MSLYKEERKREEKGYVGREPHKYRIAKSGFSKYPN